MSLTAWLLGVGALTVAFMCAAFLVPRAPLNATTVAPDGPPVFAPLPPKPAHSPSGDEAYTARHRCTDDEDTRRLDDYLPRPPL